MKRIKLLVVLVFALASNLHCTTPSLQKEKTDVEYDELIGKVKSVIETYGDEEYVKTAYDERGYRTEYSAYYADEGYGDTTFYKSIYDAKGVRIEQNIYNASGSLIYQVFYKYDKQGNNIETTTLDSKGYQNGKRIYVYDDSGNMVERYSYGASTNIPPFEKYSYTYDSKGNQIGGVGYNNSGQVTSRFDYKYDDRGNRIEQNTYYTSLSTNRIGQTSWLFEYDEKGNNKKATLSDLNGNIVSVTTYKFDNYENLIEQHDINYLQNTEENIVYKHEYDEQGNWIKKTYINTTSAYTETSKREIEYYK